MENFNSRYMAAALILFALLSASITGQDRTSLFDGNKIRETVIRLSSDEFEGRGPGTAGGVKASQYIADELKAAGALPANGKSYFQNVKLVGVKADPATVLQATVNGNTESLKFGDDFVATTGAQKSSVSVDADLVFVGYGIDSPQYQWNDYKGTPVDYRGKILLMLVNDPPATNSEPTLFGGKALTYFGRWTYKYEE